MYRTLGTRGTVFGVVSGPYAGKERLVAFRELSPASKDRLVEALVGKRQLSPILRSAGTRASLTVPAAVLLVATLFVLVRFGWPAREPLGLAAAYAAVGVALGGILRQRSRSLSHEGTSVSAGAYLFPLDLVEARRDGTLRVLPIGQLQEAAVASAPARPALVLTFKDGTVRTFPVGSEREAEAAYAALETAQEKLERLTYGSDLSDAVNLDPFFEVRIDDSWQSVAAIPTRHAGATTLGALALGAACGLGLFAARNALAHRAHEAERSRMDAQIAALKARLADQERDRSEDERRENEEAARQAEHAAWEHGGGIGLGAYESQAPNPEMAAVMTDLAAGAGRGPGGLAIYFHDAVKPCAAGAPCAAAHVEDGPLPSMERRLVAAFAQVLSETVPRAAVPVRFVTDAPSPPSLDVAIELTPKGAAPQAIEMVFDVKLDVPKHEPKTFRLTMPPPETALVRARDRSVFTLGAHAGDAELVYARGLDRLYDEIYGLFFSGPPRVPLPDRAAEETQRTFGTP